MRLLILTQTVDRTDPVLGFFHQWIVELSTSFETIIVICLKEGEHSLPANVQVYSLGKEGGPSRLKYITRFYRYIWCLRKEYDAVFVHMNQEYVVLGGLLWRLLNKHIYLWRNYHGGTVATDIAIALSTKVFCTSIHSYTAGHPKTVLMPVGVDTAQFSPDLHVQRIPNSILFLSGMWPSKRPEVLLAALVILRKHNSNFTADLYGSPLPETEEYYQSLKEQVSDAGMNDVVTFHPGVANALARDIYRAHEIFVNCSPSGMFDKTIFEAAASECLVIASSRDFARNADPRSIFTDLDATELAARLEMLLALPETEKHVLREQLRQRALAEHSLTALGTQLAAAIH